MRKRTASGIILAITVLELSMIVLGARAQLVGDLNDDGEVNLMDLVIAGQAFGSTELGPRWNPAADLNDDGKVNLIDLGTIAINFGSTA